MLATQPSDWSGSYITWQSRTNAVNMLLLLPEPVSQVFGSLVCEIEGSAWSGHHQRSVSTRWTVSSTELTARSKYIDDENLIEWIVYVSNQCTYSWLFQQWIQVSCYHLLCVITWSNALTMLARSQIMKPLVMSRKKYTFCSFHLPRYCCFYCVYKWQ